MSARRRRLLLTSDARQELSDILLYSEQQWGKPQRTAYKKLLQESMRTLAQSPFIGRPRDELSAGLRSHPAGSHIIYYWTTDTTLVVAHIFHTRHDTAAKRWVRPDADETP